MIEVLNMENILPQGVLDALSPAIVDRIVVDIAEAARNEWLRLAGNELSTTRRDYINGIQQVKSQHGQSVISLVGALPNAIEQGMDAVDMRDTLLGPHVPVVARGQRGKHAAVSKSGKWSYYRAIPFRHATPGTTGAVGPAMGSAYGGHDAVADAKKLGREVYKAAKKLEATRSASGQKVAYGGRLPAGLAPKLRPHHATDIYAGMIKSQKTYEKATQSQYTTFRTISTANKVGWIRPATQGRFFAKEVANFVQKIAPQAFSAYVESLG